MTSLERRTLYVAGLLLFGMVLPVAAREATPVIPLPPVLAVEMPQGATSLGPDEPPLSDLLAARQIAGHLITASLPESRVGIGATRVIWSASDGASGSQPIARRGAIIFVLPFGTTPVGMSADENATVGNNATHIARDASGRVHMIWVDSGRPEGRTGAMYRRAVTAPDGAIRFETDIEELSSSSHGEWNAYPGLAVTGETVHFVWQAGGTAHYRGLIHDATGWHWTPEIDTKAESGGRDVGPAIAADASSIQIVTPSGVYAVSTDGGRTWKCEPVPIPAGTSIKSDSIALDTGGGAIIVANIRVRLLAGSTQDHGSGAYWQLLTFRRASSGHWDGPINPLAELPEWGAGSNREDVVVDWTRIAMDPAGGTHLTWDGTAAERIFAHDRAYYAWRGNGSDWQVPVPLREPDASRGIWYSYAPSLALAGDIALPLVFYDVRSGARDMGFDSELDRIRDGKRLGAPLAMTQFVRQAIDTGQPANALAARFPAVAPVVYRAPDGRIWLDVLETLVPTGVPDAPKLIVYQRVDLTDWLHAK